ncbi:MAG TPA: ATP-dependent DNA helicase [Acidobacteriaceae bacterium]|nr:ATP-dependent DNA helicase [Acidobacteriaceae bacterium]
MASPSTAPATGRKLPRLEEFFSPGGILSRSGLPYEFRPGQLEMARAVERALTEKRHLIVEAGTGTGKTLAYLLPALRLGRRVIVSTGTRNLQEQIFFKDIPFLESLLGPLQVSYMKGRGNYLCRQKLYALRDQPILTGIDLVDQFNILRDWEKTTETGDRAELSTLPENSPLWSRLDARGEACLGSTCPNFDPCFITQMRRRALESDIVIVNHHLFFADLAIRKQAQNAPDAGVLPDAAAVIFDEAHELEEIASNYFGVSVSNLRFEELARDVEILLRAKQALSASLTAAAEILRERSRMFFAALPEPKGAEGRMPFDGREEFLEQTGDVYLAVLNALERLRGELDRLRGVEESSGLKKRAVELTSQISFLMESNDHDYVHWIERRSSTGIRQTGSHTWLQATPIEIASLLSNDLFETIPTVVLTSATLTVQGNFDHVERRIGLTGARELVVPSHFRYGEQALLYLPPEMPDPREPGFTRAAVDKICEVLEITRGRAFCLFTSYSQMRQVHEQLLARCGFPLLLQGTAPRNALLDEFRITPNAVLLGTSSFWQGVDVQGEQLSCVIIDKLPFAVPSDPVVAARMKAIEADGGNPFAEYQIPSAVIALKQGFGRLIRSLNDRGVLVLLDPRLQRQRYGRVFMESLPPYRVTQKIEDVKKFFLSE